MRAMRISFTLSLLFFAGVRLEAQVDTGAILGTVRDQSGGVVPGAKVTLTNEGNGFSIAVVTGRDGTYTFRPVRIGSYTLSTEAQGFARILRPHITVDIQQQVVVDFTMQPGQVTQTVTVASAAPILQVENASVGQVVNSREINALPLNGRNYTFLAQLVAGVTFAQVDSGRGYNASGMFVGNGMSWVQSNYILDGIDNNNTQQDNISGTGYAVRPPIDAIQEFKVQTSNYSAEFGRAGGAVLNATIKSGSNHFHGDVWEFIRNEKLDAADFFVNAANQPKGEYRQNQFGVTLGGPLTVPGVYSGKNRTFFFVDYEGTRIRQGITRVATVPTAAERNSGFTDFSDLITLQPGSTPPDLLGRTFPLGTIFDPATTRSVNAGQSDPVTGLTATATGYVREPFPGNSIPANRLDTNAIKLLDLYPLPTVSGLFNNYTASPAAKNDTNSGDARLDESFREQDQMFLRYSYNHVGRFTPPPLPGLANGGGFTDGNDGSTANSAVLSETHTFTPTTVNEFRLGFTRIATEFVQQDANTLGIPLQFGIQGISQYPGNGGLPELNIGGLYQLGPQGFLPNFKISNVWDVRENLTMIRGRHSLKAGFEFEYNFIPFIVPPFTRGLFAFSGGYTSIPGANVGDTGRAQFLLTPVTATVPNGVNNVGAADLVQASDFVRSTETRNYYGGYIQDDFKMTSDLTVNIGLRYEYFSPYKNMYDAQSQFVPGVPFSGAYYLFPASRKGNPPLSTFFVGTLAKDGINLVYSNNVDGIARKDNFAPRVGFAYKPNPRWVVRGGYGIFFGGFGNNSGADHQGTNNYPFLFSFAYPAPDPGHPITPNNSIGLLENGLSNIPVNSTNVQGGFNSIGREYRYPTGYYQGVNFSSQYQFTANQSVQIAYVGTFGRHLEIAPGANNVGELLPPTTNFFPFLPFPDFAPGFTYVTHEANSYYHSLQVTWERRLASGLSFLGNYTWSKCRTDARDLIINTIGDYRAPDIPGFGIQGDYALCDFDIRNVLHFSGIYEFPFGQGKRFLTGGNRLLNALAGGWSVNWILTLQDGQPITIPCNVSTAAEVGCNALLVPGQDPIGGKHNVDQWMNPAAFTNPPAATVIGQSNLAPLGGAPTQLAGPGFHRLDFSLLKQFKTSETTMLEFRAEFFNLTNTPNFTNPGGFSTSVAPLSGALDFSSPAFGQINSTRDAPNDSREIQFGLKFYW